MSEADRFPERKPSHHGVMSHKSPRPPRIAFIRRGSFHYRAADLLIESYAPRPRRPADKRTGRPELCVTRQRSDSARFPQIDPIAIDPAQGSFLPSSFDRKSQQNGAGESVRALCMRRYVHEIYCVSFRPER